MKLKRKPRNRKPYQFPDPWREYIYYEQSEHNELAIRITNRGAKGYMYVTIYGACESVWPEKAIAAGLTRGSFDTGSIAIAELKRICDERVPKVLALWQSVKMMRYGDSASLSPLRHGACNNNPPQAPRRRYRVTYCTTPERITPRTGFLAPAIAVPPAPTFLFSPMAATQRERSYD